MSPAGWTSVLLASSVLLLWASPAWSDASINPAALIRFKRDLISPETKDIIDKSLNVAKEGLTVFKDVMDKVDPNDVATVLKALGTFASLAPGIGSAISAVVSLVLIFIPTKDPVMEKFAEVNRKLDMISTKISNLKTKVKVYSFLSAYTDHEATIMTAWKKLQDISNEESPDKKTPLMKNFIDNYKSSNVEKSVDNFFHFLTVESPSISKNIHNLYKEQFKCHVREMGVHYMYLYRLMFKGMVLKQAYLRGTGQSSSGEQSKQVTQLKSLYQTQREIIDDCLKNYKVQLKKDVEEIAKGLSADDKQNIANKVKLHLDDKYSWYSWVVLVYDTKDDKKHQLFKVQKVNAGAVTVAVAHTLKSAQEDVEHVKKAAQECFKKINCNIRDKIKDCDKVYFEKTADNSDRAVQITLSDFATVTDMTKSKSFVEVPEPTIQVPCKDHFFSLSRNKISVHYSRRVKVCEPNPCQNHGRCTALFKSNQFLCDCQDGFYGETCKTTVDMSKIDEMMKKLPSTNAGDANSG